jgi:hypothetical protein
LLRPHAGLPTSDPAQFQASARKRPKLWENNSKGTFVSGLHYKMYRTKVQIKRESFQEISADFYLVPTGNYDEL